MASVRTCGRVGRTIPLGGLSGPPPRRHSTHLFTSFISFYPQTTHGINVRPCGSAWDALETARNDADPNAPRPDACLYQDALLEAADAGDTLRVVELLAEARVLRLARSSAARAAAIAACAAGDQPLKALELLEAEAGTTATATATATRPPAPRVDLATTLVVLEAVGRARDEAMMRRWLAVGGAVVQRAGLSMSSGGDAVVEAGVDLGARNEATEGRNSMVKWVARSGLVEEAVAMLDEMVSRQEWVSSATFDAVAIELQRKGKMAKSEEVLEWKEFLSVW